MAKNTIVKVLDGTDYYLLTSVEKNRHDLKVLTTGFVCLCFLLAHDAYLNAKKSKKLEALVKEVEGIKKAKGD